MTTTRGNVLAVVGAQYGSEGKGVIVNHIANDYDVHVRVGGPNAGHSFYHQQKLYKMQVIPCGWTNPNAILVLGRGMVVDPHQLIEELEEIEKAAPDILLRLRIDPLAGLLHDGHHDAEGGIHGEIHQRIGSTGHGVGAARRDRLDRDPSRTSLFGEVAADYVASHGRWNLSDFLWSDTPGMLNSFIDEGTNVLLEGTQGSGLSLIHGPWPYVTSADTNAAQMAADVGLAPRLVNRTMLVARTFPIRVAGNSGPLENEMTWDEMSERMGRPVLEQTTVTKKVRRVGAWDNELFARACTLNRPTSVALTFADYLDSSIAGTTDWAQLMASPEILKYARNAAAIAGAPLTHISTGGDFWSVADNPVHFVP